MLKLKILYIHTLWICKNSRKNAACCVAGCLLETFSNFSNALTASLTCFNDAACLPIVKCM